MFSLSAIYPLNQTWESAF